MLDRVRAFEVQQKILNILHSETPDHYSRLWLVGFLKSVGYSIYEICSLIDQEANWGNYDDRRTYQHVSSVFRTTKAFLNSFEGEPKGRGTFTKVPHDRITPKAPAVCVVGTTTVHCHFHKCSECPVKGEM